MACRECGQGCAPDAVFCPFCATVLVPPPPVGMQAANNTPPLEISGLKCARCGEECPEGYELCANCTRLDLQPELGDESNPVMKRVSIGNGDSGTSGEDQEQPAIHVQQVDSDSNTDGESPNVTMAESLRSIFSGQSVINQDTVAFLERHGTIGTDELLAELRSLHRALR